MRFYLISDNVDTLVGMRLAGVEGEVLHDAQSVERVVGSCLEDESIGIVLITAPLYRLCYDFIFRIKKNYNKPLIVEIPDRHGSAGNAGCITDYVRDAVGIKI